MNNEASIFGENPDLNVWVYIDSKEPPELLNRVIPIALRHGVRIRGVLTESPSDYSFAAPVKLLDDVDFNDVDMVLLPSLPNFDRDYQTLARVRSKEGVDFEINERIFGELASWARPTAETGVDHLAGSPGAGEELEEVAGLLLRGVKMVQQGHLDEATTLYQALLGRRPIPQEDPYFLGSIATGVPDFLPAVHVMARASGVEGILTDLLHNLAVIFRQRGDLEQAITLFRAVADARPTDARARFNLALVYDERGGHKEEVLTCLREALLIEPGFLGAQAMLGQQRHKSVAGWHFPMMNDVPRNEAFDHALRRNVGAGDLVLDIGAGSGLLSMMAARAGAERVIACEVVQDLARMATQIVDDNGYADRIRVLNKDSLELSVGLEGDLPRKADVVVAEVFDVGLFGEKAVTTLEHARTQLLREGGRIIPGGASVQAMLVESVDIVSELRVQSENTCGFEVGRFNELAAFNYSQMNAGAYEYTALSEPFTVLNVDFNGPVPQYDIQLEVVPTRSGVAHAVIFWFQLLLDESGRVDTGPGLGSTHWKQAVQLLEPFGLVSPDSKVGLQVVANQSPYRVIRFARS